VRSIAPLVLEAFVSPRPAPNFVPSHLNGNPDDDSVKNLQWRPLSEVNLACVLKAQANGNFKTPFGSKKKDNLSDKFGFMTGKWQEQSPIINPNL
jgi:hypothetical protein